jgi:hypothetical protein
MRAGGSYHRIKFFAKQVTRDGYNASSDTWDYNNSTITTRGEIRYTGGGKILDNEEKFYSKNVELIIRYRSTVVETMRIQIDGTNDLWGITYMEMLGRNESIRLTIEKLTEGISSVLILPPTSFVATLDAEVAIDLSWVNNTAKDGIVIERSKDGNTFAEVARIAKTVSPISPITTYKDEELDEETQYFYRARAFQYYNYSAYTPVVYATTSTII